MSGELQLVVACGNSRVAHISDKLKEPLNKLATLVLRKPAKRGDSIKLGVKRSGTAGTIAVQDRTREAGGSLAINWKLRSRLRCRTLRALAFLLHAHLGFRCASPQALCCHPLRGFLTFEVATSLFRGSLSLSGSGLSQ